MVSIRIDRSTALPTDYYLLPVLHNRRVCMCVCMRTNVCECGRASTCVLREMRKCKRNKATLSWLRLVCCRHEVPVTSEPITVIHMDEDVVVVNKPASIPVSGVLPELYCQKQREKKQNVCRPSHLTERHACIYHTYHTPGHTFTSLSSHEQRYPISLFGTIKPPRINS